MFALSVSDGIIVQSIQFVVCWLTIFKTVCVRSQALDYGAQWLWDTLPAGIVRGPNTFEYINYCQDEATQQTPINLDPRLLHPCPAQDADLEWYFGTATKTYKVENTGKEIKFTPKTIDGAPTAVLHNNFITELGVNQFYCLEQFHIHYSINSDRGSEHSFNGQFFPLELHFVHYGCQFGDFVTAINATTFGDPNKLAVVGVFFDISTEDNPFWAEVLKDENLAILQNAGGSFELDASLVNIDDMAPNDVAGIPDNRGPYFLYDGGLTTPPCTPIVQWHVLETKSFMSESQLKKIRTLLNNDIPPQQQAPTFRNLQPQLFKTVTSKCPDNGDVVVPAV